MIQGDIWSLANNAATRWPDLSMSFVLSNSRGRMAIRNPQKLSPWNQRLALRMTTGHKTSSLDVAPLGAVCGKVDPGQSLLLVLAT